ncbi:CaiB/BaiF CoA transferase family protein [Salinibacterium sp. PAMC 21357]|uniref:CaiB/BaiF CoA transferase family protein n=1 Tax=Salinibacterium sp. PAMC 21357 TaxID=1112215 RepID=UPI000289155A|nr:CoA transferase [Salinibacterium sp. PAMC 21357]
MTQENLATDLAAPLTGVRVADFSRVLAGPYASMMLADLGADVIKIESPAGDDTRAWTPPVDASGRGTYFESVNRNKRSVVCDLRQPDGIAEARRLALSADVVIENFRPGTMERFGLGYAELAAENPSLVYCSVTGFGAGDGAHLPGYDLLVQAVGGLMSITGDPDAEPTKVGVALVDVLTGQNAVVGIQAALRVRDRTGVGQRVEVNLLSTLLSALVNQSSAALNTGVSPQRMGNAHPSISPYETFNAHDGPFVIAVGNDGQFVKLCEILGLPELADDPRFARNEQRVANRLPLRAILQERLTTEVVAHWVDAMTAVGIPAGPVNDVGQAIEFATSLGLGTVTEIAGTDRTSKQISNPITLSRTPTHYRLVPPDLGQHQGADWLSTKGTQ